MIFTTNKHPKHWGTVLHDEDLAEAIVDRILERGRLLRLDGPSVRTKHLPKSELVGMEDVTSTGSRVSGTGAAEFPEPTTASSNSVSSGPLAPGRSFPVVVVDASALRFSAEASPRL